MEGTGRRGAAGHRYEKVFSCIVKGLSPYKYYYTGKMWPKFEHTLKNQ
ncbi:hypothetical protein CLOBOL_03027 [Enterocloster bolteae ATCC BAA-613]|uniref:Uncharacterized protein n=1 Tax=Enterocloster bolteae (strain ATCC BAA-613 / DSM 15670 / CCUG 46953 / JCM 12243 / WAL 16351) TaxID=411902 RepID=A8RRL0_ENTBW|nr:hypothetical protein CLOBOL_03027 [Enterocloster bolteae ATCC BAA-613]